MIILSPVVGSPHLDSYNYTENAELSPANGLDDTSIYAYCPCWNKDHALTIPKLRTHVGSFQQPKCQLTEQNKPNQAL